MAGISALVVNKELDDIFSDNFTGKEEYKELESIMTIKTLGDSDTETNLWKWQSAGGTGKFDEVTEGQPTPTDTLINGYAGSVEARTFKKTIPLTKETKRDCISNFKYIIDDIMPQVEDMAFETIIDEVARVIFNAGTTETTVDGKPIYSTSHPIKENRMGDGATTWSNYFQSYTSFDAALTDMSLSALALGAAEHALSVGQKRLNGTVDKHIPSILYVPSSLKFQANKILNGTYDPDNANNQHNPYGQNIKLKVGLSLDNYASNMAKSPWYLLAAPDHEKNKAKGNGIYIVFWEKPESYVYWDDDLDIWNHKTRFRFNVTTTKPGGKVRAQGY